MGLFRKAKAGLGYNDHSLKERGVKGTAKVLSSSKTHLTIGGDDAGFGGSDVYKQELLVTVPGREPYQVTYHLQGALPVGKELDVYVDPKDPNAVFVDTGTGLEAVADQLSALTGSKVGNDPDAIIQAVHGMTAQASAAATSGGTLQEMMLQNAKNALRMVQDPAQRQMLIQQYKLAGIDVGEDAGTS